MTWNEYIKQLKKQDYSWLPEFLQSALRYVVEINSIEHFWQWTLKHPRVTGALFNMIGYPDIAQGWIPASVDIKPFTDTLYYRRVDLDGVPFIKKFVQNDPNVSIMVYPNRKSDGLEVKAIRVPEVTFEHSDDK